MNTRSDLHGLTIFRFIAAFYVFLFHCNLRYKADVPDWIQLFLGNGAVGMSFFFVLSGFVMAWASRDGIKKDYYLSRLARVYPTYLLMGVLTLPFLFEYNYNQVFSYLFIFITSSQSWFPDSFSNWNFGGSWSISTELFFYLVFPLLLPTIKKKPVHALLIAISISSVIIPLAIAIGNNIRFPLYYISPMHRLPEFIAGVALGCIFIEGVRLKKWGAGLLILSVVLMVFASPIHNDGWMRNNYITLPSTCLIVYFLASSGVRKNIITMPLIYLGKISYSFYLMQLPIMMYISKYHDSLSFMPVWMIWSALAVFNIFLAVISYHFVENNKYIKFFLIKKS